MLSNFSIRSLPFAIFNSLIFGAISLATLNKFQPMQIIPCTDVWADHLILALTLAFVLQLFLAHIILPGHYRFFLVVHVALILFALWLGVYSISPLGYSDGRIPNLHGFFVITANRNFSIANKELVSLERGANVAVSPLMLAGEFHCDWMSSAGAMLDDASDCDITYNVPDVDYDVLRVHIWSSCGLPDSNGQIKISILP